MYMSMCVVHTHTAKSSILAQCTHQTVISNLDILSYAKLTAYSTNHTISWSFMAMKVVLEPTTFDLEARLHTTTLKRKQSVEPHKVAANKGFVTSFFTFQPTHFPKYFFGLNVKLHKELLYVQGMSLSLHNFAYLLNNTNNYWHSVRLIWTFLAWGCMPNSNSSYNACQVKPIGHTFECQKFPYEAKRVREIFLPFFWENLKTSRDFIMKIKTNRLTYFGRLHYTIPIELKRSFCLRLYVRLFTKKHERNTPEYTYLYQCHKAKPHEVLI